MEAPLASISCLCPPSCFSVIFSSIRSVKCHTAKKSLIVSCHHIGSIYTCHKHSSLSYSLKPIWPILIQHIDLNIRAKDNTHDDQMLSENKRLSKNWPHEEFDNGVNGFHMRGYKPLMNLRAKYIWVWWPDDVKQTKNYMIKPIKLISEWILKAWAVQICLSENNMIVQMVVSHYCTKKIPSEITIFKINT